LRNGGHEKKRKKTKKTYRDKRKIRRETNWNWCTNFFLVKERASFGSIFRFSFPIPPKKISPDLVGNSEMLNRVARWFVLKPKNPNFGKIWRALKWKMLLYLMTIWNIVRPFGIIYGLLVQFVVIWHFLQFGMFGPKKNLATLNC
jgi:hypothetical protein